MSRSSVKDNTEVVAYLNRRVTELEAKVEQLEVLLSQWYEGWNDGCEPTGDMLDETTAIMDGGKP